MARYFSFVTFFIGILYIVTFNIASDQLPTWKLAIVLLKYLNLFTSFYSQGPTVFY